MIFAYILLFAILFYKSKWNIKGFNTEGYLSIGSTKSVKGFFIILVILGHFMNEVTYIKPVDTSGGYISFYLGQLIVTMFLFYSGYGISESIKKKGLSYIKLIPKNRALKTWVNFAISVLVFLIPRVILGNDLGVRRVLLSFIGWENLGNISWYIFAIIILYLTSFVSFIIFRNKPLLAAVTNTVLIFGYIYIMSKYKEKWWYDTVICYALGIWYSFGKDKIEKLLTKNNIIYCILLVSSIAIFYFLHPLDYINIALRILSVSMFTFIVVLITLKVNFDNRILRWLSDHLFEIYIIHKLPMMAFENFGLVNQINKYLYFIIIIISTMVLAYLLKKLLDFVDNLLFKKPQSNK